MFYSDYIFLQKYSLQHKEAYFYEGNRSLQLLRISIAMFIFLLCLLVLITVITHIPQPEIFRSFPYYPNFDPLIIHVLTFYGSTCKRREKSHRYGVRTHMLRVFDNCRNGFWQLPSTVLRPSNDPVRAVVLQVPTKYY